MIKFTNATGSAKTLLYLNPEKIVSVKLYEDGTCSRLHIGDDVYYFVEETPEEVTRKVLEWRLAMIDYHHDIPSVKTKAMAELVRLAGLEEQNHAER